MESKTVSIFEAYQMGCEGLSDNMIISSEKNLSPEKVSKAVAALGKYLLVFKAPYLGKRRVKACKAFDSLRLKNISFKYSNGMPIVNRPISESSILQRIDHLFNDGKEKKAVAMLTAQKISLEGNKTLSTAIKKHLEKMILTTKNIRGEAFNKKIDDIIAAVKELVQGSHFDINYCEEPNAETLLKLTQKMQWEFYNYKKLMENFLIMGGKLLKSGDSSDFSHSQCLSCSYCYTSNDMGGYIHALEDYLGTNDSDMFSMMLNNYQIKLEESDKAFLLYLAMHYNQYRAVNLMLDLGFSLYGKWNKKFLVIFAAEKEWEVYLKSYVEHGLNFRKEDPLIWEIVYESLLNGQDKALKKFISCGFNIKQLHPEKGSLLAHVLRSFYYNPNFSLKFLSDLLAFGAAPNKRDDESLGYAAKWGHFGLVNFFLRWGADPLAANASGKTALFLAQNFEVFSLLIKACKPDLLRQELLKGSLIDKLLEITAKNLSKVDYIGLYEVLRDIASKNTFEEMCNFIIPSFERKFNNKYATSLLRELVNRDFSELYEFLLKYGVNPLQKDSNGRAALSYVQSIDKFYLFLSYCDSTTLHEMIVNDKKAFLSMPKQYLCTLALNYLPNKDDPFACAQWLITFGPSIDWLQFESKIWKELCILLAVFHGEKLRGWTDNDQVFLRGREGHNSFEEKLLAAPSLLLPELQSPKLEQCEKSSFIFTKVSLDREDPSKTTSIAELIEQVHQDLSKQYLIQYLSALHFLPGHIAVDLPISRQIEYLTLATEENKNRFMKAYHAPNKNERYLPWRGAAFQEKLLQLEAASQNKELRSSLAKCWFKEKITLDCNFSPRIELLQRFKEKFSDPTPIQEQIEALQEIEKNLKEYQVKIESFVNELFTERPIPGEYLCPLTRKDMEHPVFYYADAEQKQRIYFERDAIHTWLQTNTTSPISRAPLTMNQLQADLKMKEKINAWRFEPYNRALAALRSKMELQPEESRKQAIQEEYALTREKKLALVRRYSSTPVLAMAETTRLPAGTRLYSCTSKISMHSILAEGVLLDNRAATYQGQELGKGLYLSTEGPAYYSEERSCVLVLELIAAVDGCLVEPLSQYLREFSEDKKRVTEEYNSLKQSALFLRHSGLFPVGTEVVLHRTSNLFSIVGVAENPRITSSGNLNNSEIIPIESYCKKNYLKLHTHWK